MTKKLDELRRAAYAAHAAHERDLKRDPVYAAVARKRRVLAAQACWICRGRGTCGYGVPCSTCGGTGRA